MTPLYSTLNRRTAAVTAIAATLLATPAVTNLEASEITLRKPFAEWAEVPLARQFTVRLGYEESEGYHIWQGGNERQDITWNKEGEDYGIDRMQGVLYMEYGISKKWAADLNIGYGTVGHRSFSAGHTDSTTGLLDTTLGIRYQIVHEDKDSWMPTLTFRAGGVLPGSYDKDFPFAPGNHSTAIEPSFLVRKHFGWQGFGAYGDALYRWMRTSGDDQYMIAVGFFQEIKKWTLNVGYRHFQQLSGYDLVYNGLGNPIEYSPQVREISDAIEGGFTYATPWHGIKVGFYTRKTFDGSNTDSAFALGGFIEMPFGGKQDAAPAQP